jgi:hypothetical protein
MFCDGKGSEWSVVISDISGSDSDTLIMNELKSHATLVFSFWSVKYIHKCSEARISLH